MPVIFIFINEFILLELIFSLLKTKYLLSNTKENAFHKIVVFLEKNDPIVLFKKNVRFVVMM